jgi:tetratricopeptide (TPR) repeat protein
LIIHQINLYCAAEDNSSQCDVMDCMAESLTALQDYENAVVFYNEIIIIAEKSSDKSSCKHAMLKLGSSYMIQNKYKLAIVVFEKCLKSFCVDDNVVIFSLFY